MPRKGEHGDGVYEDPKGSSTFWARWTDERGKDRCKKIGQGDKGRRDAQKYVYRQREIVREKILFPERHQEAAPVVKWTLKQAVKDYQEHVTLAPTSIRTEQSHANAVVALWGERELADIRITDVKDWMARRMKARKASTVAREVDFLRRVYARAIERGLATSDPTKGIKRPRIGLRPPRYMHGAEEARLREHLVGHDWLAAELAYRTGLRAAEQFGLRKEYIDWHGCRIILPRPKSQMPEVVHLNTRAVDILRELCEGNDSEWVFPNTVGGHLDYDDFTRRKWRPACKAAKVHGLRWHDLRHTFGSWMAIAGVDIYRIQQLMRHRSIAMTQRYAHLLPEHLKAAVEVMAGAAPMGAGSGASRKTDETVSTKARSGKRSEPGTEE